MLKTCWRIKEDMIGRACRTRRSDEKCIQNFRPKSLKRRDHLGDVVVDERMILKCNLMK